MIGLLLSQLVDRFAAVTGRLLRPDDAAWLAGPTGDGGIIGAEFYERFSQAQGWTLEKDRPAAGLMPSFAALQSPNFDPGKVIAPVVDFYEHTAAYEFDVWSQWRGPLTPFAHAFIRLASREIEQCNLPLSPLDSSRGVESAVWPMRDADGQVRYTGWLRHVAATKNVLFVGCYTTVTLPKFATPCVKVVFPLPHGSATVLLRPENQPDGSFKLVSAGKGFGDPGFYRIYKRPDGRQRAVYLPLHEVFHLFVDADGAFRTDHQLRFAGLHFLTLHYRMRKKEESETSR